MNQLNAYQIIKQSDNVNLFNNFFIKMTGLWSINFSPEIIDRESPAGIPTKNRFTSLKFLHYGMESLSSTVYIA